MALAAIPPGLWRVRRSMSQKRISNARGSSPSSTGFRSSIVPATPRGERPSLHSPYPVTPSSVSIFTKIQGRHPASTVNVSMPLMRIAEPPRGRPYSIRFAPNA